MSVSRSECQGLLNALGLYNPAVPGDCATLTLKSDQKISENERHSSWLWPSLARRATNNRKVGAQRLYSANWLFLTIN